MKAFRSIFSKRKDDLDDEIQAHLFMAIQDRKDRGESEEDARSAAIREFGNVPLVKDVTRQMWGWNLLERLTQDLRYAVRQLGRSPGFSTTIIATLALGLAATTAMYTVVDRVLLRPLPYENPDRLLDIKESGRKGIVDTGAAYLDIKQWQERSRTIERLAFYNSNSHFGHLAYLEGTSSIAQVETPKISGNLF